MSLKHYEKEKRSVHHFFSALGCETSASLSGFRMCTLRILFKGCNGGVL